MNQWKNGVDWILGTWWDKTMQPQKFIFSVQEPKKFKNVTCLHFMNTLNNVVLKTEIGFQLEGYLGSL